VPLMADVREFVPDEVDLLIDLLLAHIVCLPPFIFLSGLMVRGVC
jgi:hypothetical protein